ncbi:hypothetical protein [Hydrogenimonas sp. SS33]|uniref:hypothetical protein n=1 Tax=Hydrogenimonas leucolamina TaxID=2954236 RepID=UPI00336BC955
MKKIVLLLLSTLLLSAGELDFNNIETTVLMKKEQEPVNVALSLVLQGRDVSDATRFKLMDVVQTALGSLWAETLVTAQGKTQLKKMIIKLADSQYGIEVDFVYILDVRLQIDTLKKCLELIKEAR